eukprot:353565-Chlamydomonas_euryale.AAC.1
MPLPPSPQPAGRPAQPHHHRARGRAQGGQHARICGVPEAGGGQLRGAVQAPAGAGLQHHLGRHRQPPHPGGLEAKGRQRRVGADAAGRGAHHA